MADFTIILGNKNYSSWSLRAWLMLEACGTAYDEVVIPLDQPDTKSAIRAHTPSGRVPTLKHGDLVIWDSLAIGEYLAERFPDAGLWPSDPAARARARSICAEMHAGFPALRENLPMDLRNRPPGQGVRAHGVAADIMRIAEIWEVCRQEHGRAGDFLFGGFGIADAFFAPVVGRFVTYGVALEGATAAYRDAVWSWPAMKRWRAAGEAEPWVIEQHKVQPDYE